MDINEYKKIEKVEDVHWWFRGRRDIVLYFLKQIGLQSDCCQICDVGCGMGAMLRSLTAFGNVYGFDMEPIAVDYCNELLGCGDDRKVLRGELPYNVPFEQSKFDVVVAMDVLEHVDNDVDAVDSLVKLMKKNGYMLITVPALQMLWSYNDVFCHHKRRYTRKQLIDIVENKCDIIKCSYFNSFLFLPIFFIRTIKNLFNIRKDDLNENVKSNRFNEMLYRIFISEVKWLKQKEFNFGVSILLIAQKK